MYRDYGFVFIEQTIYDAAIAVYIISFSYADEAGSQIAENELSYIQSLVDLIVKEYRRVVDGNDEDFANYYR